MNTYINLSEAQDDARRLTKDLRRGVDVAAAPCDCDYSNLCFRCAGSGTFYELRYAFCNHVVQESDDLECAENNCESRERQARGIERPDTWPRVGKPLQSCEQVQIERDEAA